MHTLSVNGKTFTGTVAANGKFSINVPGADLAADPDTQLEARITGTGGTAATALQDYALSSSAGGDRNAVIPPSGELAPGSDSGVPGDGITNDTRLTLTTSPSLNVPVTLPVTGKVVAPLSLASKTLSPLMRSRLSAVLTPVGAADSSA